MVFDCFTCKTNWNLEPLRSTQPEVFDAGNAKVLTCPRCKAAVRGLSPDDKSLDIQLIYVSTRTQDVRELHIVPSVFGIAAREGRR